MCVQLKKRCGGHRSGTIGEVTKILLGDELFLVHFFGNEYPIQCLIEDVTILSINPNAITTGRVYQLILEVFGSIPADTHVVCQRVFGESVLVTPVGTKTSFYVPLGYLKQINTDAITDLAVLPWRFRLTLLWKYLKTEPLYKGECCVLNYTYAKIPAGTTGTVVYWDPPQFFSLKQQAFVSLDIHTREQLLRIPASLVTRLSVRATDLKSHEHLVPIFEHGNTQISMMYLCPNQKMGGPWVDAVDYQGKTHCISLLEMQRSQ